MKVIKWSLNILAIIFPAIVGGGYFYFRATVPSYNGEIVMNDIDAPVDIVRDSCGVPHIFAENEGDAYFALGYSMAQDRLFQMEMMRLLSQGRLSELMGEKTVDIDKLYRTIHCAHDWPKAADSRNPLSVPVEDAFIRGINAYLAENHVLPVPLSMLGHRPAPYTYMDMASLLPLYTWMTTDPLRPELLKAAIIDKVGPEMADELFSAHTSDPATIPMGEPCFPGFDTARIPRPAKPAALDGETAKTARNLLLMASNVSLTLASLGVQEVHSACNSMVISGENTGTGKPLLAQDFHFPYIVPSYLYEASISTPDNKVGGYIFVGQPYVMGGQNEHMAWVFTAGCGDLSDVYVEKLNPSDRNEYLYRDAYEQMTVRKEVIKIKGAEDVEIEVRSTRHGVVMDDLINDTMKPESADISFALRLASADSYRESEGLYRINTARNADDFIAAMEFYKCPDEHWIYADENGDIGYIYGGALPARKGFDGSVLLPGWTGEFEWDGYVPTTKQPQLRNPKMGFINTSNAIPAPEYYPYPQGTNYIQSDRLARVREDITQTITQKGAFTADDVEKIFADSMILRAREWVPLLLQAAGGGQLAPNEKKALELLARWDFVSDKNSAPALIFQATLVQMVRNTILNKLGEQLSGEYIADRDPVKGLKNLMVHENSAWFDDPATPDIEGRAELLLKSFREAVKFLEEKAGSNVEAWRLGDLLKMTIRSPLSRIIPSLASILDIGPMPVNGGIVAPYNTAYSFDKPFEVTSGTQARLVVDFADRRNCKIVNMPGISENFMSPHYSDQVKMWYNFRFRPLVLYREEADRDAKYLLRLLPE